MKVELKIEDPCIGVLKVYFAKSTKIEEASIPRFRTFEIFVLTFFGIPSFCVYSVLGIILEYCRLKYED